MTNLSQPEEPGTPATEPTGVPAFGAPVAAPQGHDEGEGAPDPDPALERLMEVLGPEQKMALTRLIAQSESHSGPLPTPGYLREYDIILPGLADRITQLPEREQAHRHDFLDRWLAHDFGLKTRGQTLAIAAMGMILVFCLVLASLGDTKMAGAVAIALVIGVVSIFVTGKVAETKSSGKEPEPDL